MQFCHVDVIKVQSLGNYKLYLQFDDGVHGEIDISKLIQFKGIFEPLKDKAFFSRVDVNPDIGTIYWDNGADLSPTYLHENIVQKK
ncbi:MAG: DUF2442 domain-containing protein [Pseudomonadota bacterium]